MIEVENDYESVIYEQPFQSHIYENQIELLQFCCNRPTSINIPSTNHIYQNIQKDLPKEKIWTISFLLESPKSKKIQPPDLEISFLIDSGAELNIINIPTWKEIKITHPKLLPLKTTSKLATSLGSTLTKYG